MTRNSLSRRRFMTGAVAAAGSAADAANESPPPAGKVPRKALGKTGEKVPILIMGCTLKFDEVYDKRLHRAFNAGVDYLDTAQVYAAGQSHKTLATFIQQIGDRKKVWITSKVKLFGDMATPDRYRKGLDRCLRDLQTDYLDMFFMHMIVEDRHLSPELIKMAEELKKSGIIRYFGFSVHDGNAPAMMNKAAQMGGGIDAVMFRYNFREYGDIEINKAIDACANAGIGLIAMKTQAGVPDDHAKVVTFTSKDFTLGQAKLKAVWADDRITAIASKMSSVQEVEENIQAAMSEKPLAVADFHQLNRLAAHTAAYHCLGCNHRCESQVRGPLKIADTLRYLMYAECYGDGAEARNLYESLRPEERDFEGVDLRGAMTACPQGIDIAARLARAKRILSA